MTTVNMVVGATTDEGATFVAKVSGGGPVRVAVANNSGMTSPVFTGSQAVDAQGVAKVSITGLDPATPYWWQVEDNSVLDGPVGRFQTHPTEGLAASFTIAVSGDAGLDPDFPGDAGGELDPNLVSNAPTFETIRQLDPLMFVQLGDWGYPDWSTNLTDTLANRRTFYDDNLAQTNQAALLREIPWSYLWDDHDFANNDSDGTYADKANAATVYRERVPHYPLDDASAIYQSWQVGRVLFVMLDCRYYRSPNSDPDGPSKTMLGSAQKTWLEDLLTNSTAEALVCIMSSQWLHPSGSDTWVNFATERDELAAMFQDTGWANRMVVVYGDRHAIGIDSGANNAWGGFPVLMAAAVDASPSVGDVIGFYDVLGSTGGRDQYGTITVTDVGTAIGITLNAYSGSVLMGSYTLSISLPLAAAVLTDVTHLLHGSVDVVYDVRILETFQTGDDPVGTSAELLSGEVTLDATTDVRGDASIRIAGTIGQDGPPAWPRGKDRLFAPFGNEVFIRYGFELGGSVGTLWIPLGYYAIMDTDQEDAPDGAIELSCEDRMAPLIESELIDPRVYDPPMTVGDVFDDLILDVYPEAVIQFDDATGTIPLARQVIAEQSRYKPLKDLAEAFGKIFYWDDIGIARIETPPDPNEIAWFVRSQRDGVLINANRKLSRRGIFNAIIIEGEGADDKLPVRVVVYDNDPNSPTRFGGPIGKVPKTIKTPLITTVPQGITAGRTLLQLALGAPYSVKFDAVVNPTLRPLQAIEIMYSNNERDVHIVDSVTIPLDEDHDMSTETREQALIISEII